MKKRRRSNNKIIMTNIIITIILALAFFTVRYADHALNGETDVTFMQSYYELFASSNESLG